MHPKHDKRTGEDDVEDVVYAVGDEVGTTAGETCTLEHVDDVVPELELDGVTTENAEVYVHHDVHTGELRPHLERSTERDTAEDTRLEEVEVGLGALLALKVDLLLDLRHLQLDELVVRVALPMQVRQDLQRLLVAPVVDEPTRTLRKNRR